MPNQISRWGMELKWENTTRLLWVNGLIRSFFLKETRRKYHMHPILEAKEYDKTIQIL